jgi:cytochrome c biogenesis protein CcmG, thiol:disulfide interchange protein DsbE
MRTLVFAAWLAASLPVDAVDVGQAVPALTLPGLDGAAAVRLESLKGRVVYVDFWASWCVPCRVSMPALEALWSRQRERGFTVLGVNKDVAPEDARRFLERVKVGFPLVADASDAAVKAFAVKAMPSGYLVDRAGKVRFIHRGFTNETGAELARQVEDLLKESP